MTVIGFFIHTHFSSLVNYILYLYLQKIQRGRKIQAVQALMYSPLLRVTQRGGQSLDLA